MKKVSQIPALVAAFGMLVLSTSCQGKSCWQTSEVRWTIYNDTSTPKSPELNVTSGNNIVETKIYVLEANSKTPLVVGTYSYEKKPVHHGKIDFSPSDAQCFPEAESSLYSEIELSAAASNSGLKMCYVPFESVAHILNAVDPCPGGTSLDPYEEL
jgi:hypothetical protein